MAPECKEDAQLRLQLYDAHAKISWLEARLRRNKAGSKRVADVYSSRRRSLTPQLEPTSHEWVNDFRRVVAQLNHVGKRSERAIEAYAAHDLAMLVQELVHWERKHRKSQGTRRKKLQRQSERDRRVFAEMSQAYDRLQVQLDRMCHTSCGHPTAPYAITRCKEVLCMRCFQSSEACNGIVTRCDFCQKICLVLAFAEPEIGSHEQDRSAQCQLGNST